MATHLRLVVDAAERDAHELAPERARDRLAERGLADAGRADEAQDRASGLPARACAPRGTRGCALDLLQAVVVLVEDAARLPRCRSPPARASSTAARSASRGRSAPSSTRPTTRACARGASAPSCACATTSSGMPAFVDRLREIGELRRAPLAFAELLLDLAHLLAQHVLALALVDRSPWSALDLARELASSGCDARAARVRWSTRAFDVDVSSTYCFSAGLMSIKPATMSASSPAEV